MGGDYVSVLLSTSSQIVVHGEHTCTPRNLAFEAEMLNLLETSLCNGLGLGSYAGDSNSERQARYRLWKFLGVAREVVFGRHKVLLTEEIE